MREDEDLTEDFTNMVMFCRKLPGQILFRDPVEADFLGSHARKGHLLPKHEIGRSYFDRPDDLPEQHVLRRGNTKALEASQQESALGHWNLMRTVLPDFVWENW